MNLKSFFTTFFLFFFLTSYSQTIKGIVLEKIHKLPIENIEIIYNKKSFFTDIKGEFKFKIIPDKEVGNLIIQIGKSNVMFSSHMDTVQKTSGDKNVILFLVGGGVGVFPFKFEQPFPYIWLFCFFLAFINALTKDVFNESIYLQVGYLFGTVVMTTVIAYLITVAFNFLVDRFIPD